MAHEERKRMNNEKHGLDAKKIRTEGSKGNEWEVNTKAQGCKGAEGRPGMHTDSLIYGAHRSHGTGGDSRATPPISADLILIRGLAPSG